VTAPLVVIFERLLADCVCVVNQRSVAVATIVVGSLSAGIVVGNDGNLWFPEQNANKIGHMATDGTGFGESAVLSYGKNPFRIAVGSDQNLWFTCQSVGVNNAAIGKITTAGVITEYHPAEIPAGPAPTLNSPTSAPAVVTLTILLTVVSV